MATRTYELAGRSTAQRGPGRAVVVASVVAVAVGVAAAIYPLAAFLIVAVVVVLALGLRNLPAMERTVTTLLVGGAMLLGYGFANLGIRTGGIPIPATEMLFLPLAVIALTQRRTLLDSRVLWPLTLYALLVLTRLFFDFPNWGPLAVRDSTAALEAFVLVVGYRALTRDGVQFWVRRMGYICGAVVLYGATAPFESRLLAISPTVGLQRPTPLLDQRGVKFSVVAAGLYFLIFSRGWKRIVALGLVTGLVGIFQARSLYILFPLAILVVGWAGHRLSRVALQLVPIVLVGALLLTLAGNLGFSGRRGELSFTFIEAHARTLLGEEGPMAGSIEGREDVFGLTMDYVTRSPWYVIGGVGLGPNLAFGTFEGKQGQEVRQPHDDYLEVFARTGLIGFTLFIWMLLACLVPIARKARSGTGLEENLCAWILAAATVYLGVAGAQPLLSFPYGSVPLFFLLGLGVAVALPPRSRNEVRALAGPPRYSPERLNS
jgi:O-antigen ligase